MDSGRISVLGRSTENKDSAERAASALPHMRLLDGSSSAPLVSVMQPAQHRDRDNPARLRRLDRPGVWSKYPNAMHPTAIPGRRSHSAEDGVVMFLKLSSKVPAVWLGL